MGLQSRDGELLCEFGIKIDEMLDISLHYKRVLKRDLNNLSTITEFPPYLFVSFKKEYPTIHKIKEITSEIFSLFYALTGFSIVIEKAYLSFPGNTNAFPYYISDSSAEQTEIENSNILMPYNSRFTISQRE